MKRLIIKICIEIILPTKFKKQWANRSHGHLEVVQLFPQKNKKLFGSPGLPHSPQQNMAARVGLPQQALLASGLARSPSRARLPYPPLLLLPTYRRLVSASADAGLPYLLRRRRPFATRAMSQAVGSPYAAELAAAKKAVSLAARLCQVLPLGSLFYLLS